MKQRLLWIDTIKGVGILSVMLYHVPFFIFGVKHTILNDIIQLFFMPVFFMASGYLSGNILTKQLTTKEWFNFKTYSIMIPFFVVGGINILLNDMMNDSLSLKKNPINELLFADSSRGYWFLLVLFFFKVISIIGKQISQIFHIKNILIIVLIIFVIGEVLSRIIYAVWGMESMIRVYYNLPFYLVAMIIRQDKFFKLEGGGGILFVASIISIILEFAGAHYSALTGFLLRISPTMFIFYFIKERAVNSFTYNYLSKLGKISLEIYIFHYFCFIGLDKNWLPTMYYENLPPLIQVIINVFFSSALICFSYILAKISNATRLGRLIFLGKR